MQVSQTRVDLLQVHSTLDLLKGLPKDMGAAFAFLTTKSKYNWAYGEIEKGLDAEIKAPGLSVSVTSVDQNREGHKNFWRGTTGSTSTRTYAGYVGKESLADLAWQRLVPFRTTLPIEAKTLEAETGWSIEDGAAFLWPCGWAVSLTLRIDGALSFEELVDRLSLLKSRAVPITVGDQQSSQTLWNALSSASHWIQSRIMQPVLQRQISPPVSASPYLFVAVERPGKQELPKVPDMDEGTQRLIYALASQDPAWKAYSAKKIRENFKEIDEYADSFIYMERTGRFFWFPALMKDMVKGLDTLDCYIETTKSAMMMVLALSQFVRLLADRQTGTDLKANPPLRDLFTRATLILEEFQTRYKNTNVKRLAADLNVAKLIADARARLI